MTSWRMEEKRPTASDIKRIAKKLKKNGFHVYRYRQIMALRGKLTKNISPYSFSAARTNESVAVVRISWWDDVVVRIWPRRGRRLAQKALDIVYGKDVLRVDKLRQFDLCIKLPLDLSGVWK